MYLNKTEKNAIEILPDVVSELLKAFFASQLSCCFTVQRQCNFI